MNPHLDYAIHRLQDAVDYTEETENPQGFAAIRRWINVAKEARDRAAEEAARGLRALQPLLDGKEVTELERVRRIAIAIDAFQTIARLLESQGAQTRP